MKVNFGNVLFLNRISPGRKYTRITVFFILITDELIFRPISIFYTHALQ